MESAVKGDMGQMKATRWILGGGVLAAIVLVATLGTQAVFADTTTPPTPPAGQGAFPGGGHRMRGLGPEELDAAAGVLGMTGDELSAELQSGKTLADVATEQGVAIEDVQAAIREVHQQEMLARINQAVADGSMTQDKADWLKLGLEKGYMDGPGFGIGFGFGPGGPRGGLGPRGGQAGQP
jgi:hypothetical protein